MSTARTPPKVESESATYHHYSSFCSFPATAALTGPTTHASHQLELTNCASLLSPREGQSVTHCQELDEERLLQVADTFGVSMNCYFCCFF